MKSETTFSISEDRTVTFLLQLIFIVYVHYSKLRPFDLLFNIF